MSRSETTPGPGGSSSMTTAAPTPFSVIRSRGLAQRVAGPDGQHHARHPLANFHLDPTSSRLDALVQIGSNPNGWAADALPYGTDRARRMDRIPPRAPPLSRSRRRIARARLAIAAARRRSAALVVAGCDATEDADTERGRALFQQQVRHLPRARPGGHERRDRSRPRRRLSPRRAPTAWTTTRSRASSRPRSRTRASSRRAPQNYDRVYMPADLVTGQDAEDVAAYVASVAGVPGAKPPQLAPPAAVRREVRHLPRARGGGHQLGRPARTSTRRWPARTPRTSSSRSSTPTRRSPRASPRGSCPRTSSRR